MRSTRLRPKAVNGGDVFVQTTDNGVHLGQGEADFRHEVSLPVVTGDARGGQNVHIRETERGVISPFGTAHLNDASVALMF